MKTLKKIGVLFILFNVFICLAPQKITAQVSVSFQVFYDNLSPYGNWIDNSSYGYVWVPNLSIGFTPYHTNGYWVFTDMGWTWVSNYSWGWAPFHYGRWFLDSYYGWVWVPDTSWAPAWVTWRVSDGYYGWAPIGPGISIDIAFSSGYNVPYNHWTFVRDRDFGRTNINNYYVNSSNNVTIINNSNVVNNIQSDNSNNVKYNAGPRRDEVRKRTGREITQVSLKERNKPGQNFNRKELHLYKPQVENTSHNDGQKRAPSRVFEQKDIKPISERKVETQTRRGEQNIERKLQQKRRAQLNKQEEDYKLRRKQLEAQQKSSEQFDKQQKMQEQHNERLNRKQERGNQLAREQQMQQQVKKPPHNRTIERAERRNSSRQQQERNH